jgi:multidrug resistance efflux pump
MNRRTMWAAGGLLLLAGVGVVFLKPAFAPVAVDDRQDNAELTDAQRKALQERIRNTVRERGMLESADTLEIRCGLDHPSTIVFVVRDGATVTKGDVLLRLDDTKLNDELAIETINVARLTAAVDKAGQTLAGRKAERTATLSAGKLAVRAAELGKTGYLATDGEYQLQLNAADAAIGIAQKRVSTAMVVVKYLKANSRNLGDIAKAETELLAAEHALALEKAKKTLLTKHTLPRTTAEHEAAVAKGEAESLHTTMNATVALSQAEGELQTRKAELRIAQSKRERIDRQLKRCVIAAPRDGVVLHAVTRSRRVESTTIEPGTAVRPRQTLLQMPDVKRLQVRVKVHETNAHRVRPRQAVSLRFDAIPDTVFHGTVKSISSFPERGEWPNTDLMLYEVLVTIDKPSPVLKIGMSALAEIRVSQ